MEIIKELSEKELEYYSRQIVLDNIGYTGQLKLRNAKVCIVGMGGLGSPLALQLASMGIGSLRLVDGDIVEISNLQRQILYNINSLGLPKVEAASKRLNELNPFIEIEPIPLFLDGENAEDIIKGSDVVVDGLDQMTPRYALNRASHSLGIPYVFAAAIMTYGNISTIVPGKTACLECFQGNLDDSVLPSCAVVGVHPAILGIIASIEVTEVVRLIQKKPPCLANKVLYCDLESLDFEKIDISKSKGCPVCGLEPVAPPKPLLRETVKEICGRRGSRVFIIIPRSDLQLDINKAFYLLRNLGMKQKAKGKLGITFNLSSEKGKVSLLKTGIMILEGKKDKKEAYDFYTDLIVNRLNTDPSKIE